MATTHTTAATPSTTVQHITKASSDQLLSKFAALDSPDHRHHAKKPLHLLKRHKTSAQSMTRIEISSDQFAGGGASLAERKSLLPTVACRSSGVKVLVRQLKGGRSTSRARSFRKRSFLEMIEKTWQRTVDGASKVFMEKQYNRHKRLLSDTT